MDRPAAVAATAATALMAASALMAGLGLIWSAPAWALGTASAVASTSPSTAVPAPPATTPTTSAVPPPVTAGGPEVYVKPGAGLAAPAATTSPSRPLGKFLGLGALVLMLVLYSEGFGLLGGRFRSLSSRPDPTGSARDP